MRRAAALLMFAACGGAEGVTPLPRAIDLGGGLVAWVWQDGRVDVRKDGATIVRSLGPIGARSLDAEALERFHDPKKTDAWAFQPAAVEIDSPEPGVLRVSVPDDGSPTALVRFALAAAGDFTTGLGERFDHVGAGAALVPMHMEIVAGNESGTSDRHVPVPLLVSTKGWAFFVESREAGAFDVASTHADAITATFEGRGATAYFFVARDPLEALARYQRHAGLPRKMPRWALGPMLWHNEWSSRDDVLGVAREIRKRRLPTTTLWIDNPWESSYNDFRLDPSRFSDSAEMMAILAALGFRTVAWSTPYLEPAAGAPADEAQQLYLGADADGLFVHGPDGKALLVPGFDAKRGFGMIDFSSPSARAFWADLASRATSAGFSGFKLDYGEDLVPTFFGARLRVDFADGTTERAARAYPLGYHRAYHDALDRAAGGVTIARASSFGGAAETDVIWPGDLCNELERAGDPNDAGLAHVGGLPAAVVAAETLGASGFPSFASDTGGFRHGKPGKEALLRWAEHTALSVVMQLGGGGDSHDPWTYDEETATLYGRLASLHQRLFPYLSSLLDAAETTGAPTLVPLPLAFPSDDGAAARADDEYMLGPDLLVAPVLTPGATARAVHLPPGPWARLEAAPLALGDLASGDATVPAPLGATVAFVRAGALLPLLPDGVDTLADAADPNVVTLASLAGAWEALGLVSGDARAVFPDGSRLEVTDASDGVHARFTGRAAVVTLDLRLRAPVTAVVAKLPNSGTLSGGRAVLKFFADSEIVLR